MTDKTPGSRISSANLLRKITGAGVILFVILVTSFSFQNCVPSDDKGFSVQPSAPQFVEDFSEPGDLPRTCYAGTVSLVRSCLSSIISGGADHLKIHRMITCSTVNECRFDLKPLGQRVIKTVIYGSKRTTTGFTRTANFNYPILNLQDGSNF